MTNNNRFQHKASRRDLGSAWAMVGRKRMNGGQHPGAAVRYPQFILDESNIAHVPEEWANGVRESLRTIRLNNRLQFSEQAAEIYRQIKRDGFSQVCGRLALSDDVAPKTQVGYVLTRLIGDRIFNKLNDLGILSSHLPYCNVVIGISHDFHVQLDAMLRASTDHGTIYYSRHQPVVHFAGKDYTFAFSQHAMGRVAERAVYGSRSFCGAVDAFSYLSNLTRLQATQLVGYNSSQLSVEFFTRCSLPCYSRYCAEQITGRKIEAGTKQYIRVGYAILAINESYAVAKTFLSPGMCGTPEHAAIMRSGLQDYERNNLLSSLGKAFTLESLMEHRDFSALRWVHNNGVPQVVELSFNPFGGEEKLLERNAELIRMESYMV